ncbi:MAG: TlyA family RNA methyltransferase [Metamycoplasmataceae bacterium]
MTLLEKLILMGYEERLANSLIKIGNVYIDNEKVTTPKIKIKEEVNIKIKETRKYVSRGAYKLLSALEEFEVNPDGLVCLDIGSSTGGFTQVLLEHGAKFVYALDVGTNQLDYKLRSNSQVKSLEKTNLKQINKQMFDQQIDLIVCDVSFISLKQVFDVIADILIESSFFIALIKPQYEVNSNDVSKGGFAEIELHQGIIDKIVEYSSNNFELIKIIKSPILGSKSKNIEYLSLFRKKKNE